MSGRARHRARAPVLRVSLADGVGGAAVAGDAAPDLRRGVCEGATKAPSRIVLMGCLESVLHRHANADGHCLIVTVVLGGGRTDTDESDQLTTKIGAYADVEQNVVAVGFEYGNRKSPRHRHQPAPHAPVVVVVVLFPTHAPERSQGT